MVYPAAGIAVSTGSAWGTSLTDNSANWNTAFSWGNHAGLYSLLNHTHTFASLTSKPTTLVGYGITDAATSAQGTKADTAYGWGNHAIAGYLTGITSGQVTTALGFTPYNATNPSNYITTAALSTYATQSYVGTAIANLVASAPAALDTLNELAAALGNDAAFSTTISTALGNRLRVDINTQGLSATLQGYGRTNLGLGTAATSNTGDFVAYRTFGTAANNNTGDFALASHTHSIANVTGLQTALDGKQASGSYAASSHSHIISDVTGLQTALDGKQASLGFTPYNSTNPSGYITGISFANVSSKPTTISGYGITDAITTGNIGSQTVLGINAQFLGTGSINVSYGYSAVLRNENGSGANLAYSPTLHMSASDTMWQLQGTYGTSGNGTLYFRQGYSGSWGNWLTMISSANIGSQSVSYATSSGSASTATSASYLTGGDSSAYMILLNANTGDLNTYNTAGLYSSEYTGTTNRPVANSGHWIQISDAGGTDVKTQWYYTADGGSIYMRLMWGNAAWKPWRTLLTDNNVGTMAYASTSSYAPYGNWGNTAGLNDYKLYLRTNNDNNHYLWNAGDDWEELNAYEGTGFRVTSVGGTVGVLYVYGSSNGGYTYSPYSFRAPVFYDSNDTNYFFDGDGQTRAYRMNLSSAQVQASGNAGGRLRVSSWTNGESVINGNTHNIVLGPASTRTGAGYYYAGIAINGLMNYSGITAYDVAPHIWIGAYYRDTPGSERSDFIVAIKSGTGTSGAGSDLPEVRVRVDYSGNLTASGDITAYSDVRVKENIFTINNALSVIQKLRGVRYNRIDIENKKTKIGVIAQETELVLPEVVDKDSTGMYNVSYGNMAGLFIEAIKEQQTQIESQKSEIEELKDLVKQLINR
jgi:hypothetical protein